MKFLMPILGASLGASIISFVLVRRMARFFSRLAVDGHWLKAIAKINPGLLIRAVSRPEKLNQLAAAAGVWHHQPAFFLMSIKQVSLWAAFIILLLFYFLNVPLANLFWIALPALYLALRGPEIYCFWKIKKRQSQINRSLPRLIDGLLLYVRAGLNIEGAFRELASRLGRHWGKEWGQFLKEMEQGLSFRQALKNLSERSAAQEFRRFLSVLEQSQTLGVSLTETLTIQSDLMRQRRRQKAEELARTAAVKISLPLVFFIFPALLIVFLAPAVLQLMRSFQ